METETIKNESVSILICSRNRRIELERLIGHLQKIKTTCPFEIIAVEETDSPRSIDGIVYINHPIRDLGIPYARNLAFKKAKGSIIVFIDDDCMPSDSWLDKLLYPFHDMAVVGVQGGVTIPKNSNVIGWAETILGFPGGGIKRIIGAKGRNQETKEISTLNCAYRRWIIEKIGGFNENLKLGSEDYLLAKQVCTYGRCLFVPEAIVYHEPRGNMLDIWSWFVRRGRAEAGIIKSQTQKYTTLQTVLKGSIFIKLLIFIIIAFPIFQFLTKWLIVFSMIAFLSVFFVFQYSRYYNIWKTSSASISTFLSLPIIKLWMDLAMDFGRFRGFLFDYPDNSHIKS